MPGTWAKNCISRVKNNFLNFSRCPHKIPCILGEDGTEPKSNGLYGREDGITTPLFLGKATNGPTEGCMTLLIRVHLCAILVHKLAAWRCNVRVATQLATSWPPFGCCGLCGRGKADEVTAWHYETDWMLMTSLQGSDLKCPAPSSNGLWCEEGPAVTAWIQCLILSKCNLWT